MNLLFKGISSLLGRIQRKHALRHYHRSTPLNPPTKPGRILCWGDSMTAGVGASVAYINNNLDVSGLSYPEILGELTGIETLNCGVSGATSEEIGIMQGGIKTLRPLDTFKHINYQLMNKIAPAPKDILILEIGSNGGWNNSYDTLITQYRSMLAYAKCTDYIIIGDTDEPLNSADAKTISDYRQKTYHIDTLTPMEAALSEAFGEHFINMRLKMLEKGEQLSGLTYSETDKKRQAKGIIAHKLRADWTHFNSYGYYVKAVCVYRKGIELGYWN